MTKKVVTNNGKQGGWLVGKRHYDKSGKPLGGIKAVVTDAGGKPVELEGGEVIINREASKKHWKELSRINQSAGNGVAIEPPTDAFDEDPSEDYENGGKIEFNANHIPNKWILNYAIKIKEEHPDVWALGGNIFGNQAFINLKRVAERGHWLDSEEWMYKKWRSFVARHKGDFRIAGVIAMLKWVDKVDKGWQYMKNLIEEEIKKREAKKSRKMSDGGKLPDFNNYKTVIKISDIKNPNEITSGGIPNKYKGTYKRIFNILNEDSIFSEVFSEDDYLIGNDLYVFFNETFDAHIYDKISKLKNVEIVKQMSGGGNLSKTPAPVSERISGSKTNPKGTAKDAKSASSIKFDENTIASIKSLIDTHNKKHPSKKITLSVAKAVVRRGMGAYSATHRPTITGGKPNSRTAWGLARLKAFIYKAQTGKSKSGKYSQDNDLFEELNISVQKMDKGGSLNNYKIEVQNNFDNTEDFDIELEKIKIIRSYIDFDLVEGKLNETDGWLSFYKNGKRIFYIRIRYYEGSKMYGVEPSVGAQIVKDSDGQEAEFDWATFGPMGEFDKELFLNGKHGLLEALKDLRELSMVNAQLSEEKKQGIFENGGGVDSKREYLEKRLWNERGYDYPYLNKLSLKELRSLYDTEFYYDVEMGDELFEDGGGLNDCIDFIKNSEAIKNNGYYLEFKNLSIYIGSGDKVISKIKSIFLITYNSGGQKNLKPIDTINSIELANKLANLLNVEIGVARIIVSEQLTHSKRFEINKINSIVNKNIIIADRDTIVCTNLPIKLFNGGDVSGMSWYSDFKKQQLKKGTEHELEHRDTIEKFKRKGVSDREVAEQIAKDHLEEDENYYIELDKMERKKFATGGLVTDKGGEAKVGDKGILETRNGNIEILITGITDKKVRFKIISDNNRPDSNPVERFTRNYRGSSTGITTPTSTSTTTPTPLQSELSVSEVADVSVLSDFYNTKIKVKNEDESVKFQDLIITLGGAWVGGAAFYKNTDKNYLFVDDNGILSYAEDSDYFDSKPNKEVFYKDIFEVLKPQQTSGEWRTKTEEELLNDGTLDSSGLFNGIGMEDLRPFLGKTLSELNASPLFKEELDKGNKHLTPLLDGWAVRPNLFTKKPLPTTQTNVANLGKTKPQEFGNYILKKNVTKDDFENIKIIVDTPEKSEAFQKAAFDLGIEWSAYGKIPGNKQYKYLFVRPDIDDKLGLGYSDDFTYFDKKASRQIYFDDLFELKQQTNVAEELSNYRIKTKVEMEMEFGINWRTLTGWADSSNMDWMFGKPITEIVDKAEYDSVLDNVVKNKRFNCSKKLDPNGISWNIFREAYKYDPQVAKPILSKESLDELFKEVKEIDKEREALEATPKKNETQLNDELKTLEDEYNDLLFLISITPSTDVDNMIALKLQAKQLKEKIDLLHLDLKKKIDGELQLLDNLFNASVVQPQERYKFNAYNDGFAPDGQPTSLPKNLYDWTMSQEFQNWFGNFTNAYNYRNSSYENVPCSVVVNKNYEPLVVYHGTGVEFSFFKFDKFPAMYFAENEAYSNWFAELKGQQSGTNGYVYPFFLNIRTPLDLTIYGIEPVAPDDFIDWMFLQTGLDAEELKISKALLNPTEKYQAWMYLRNSPEMLNVLRDKAICDGIIYYEDNPSVDKSSDAYQTKAYIVFNSNSAKIADPNREIMTIPAMRSFYLKRGGKL
jgi:hypothetical protein